jgi:hypothetical protein
MEPIPEIKNRHSLVEISPDARDFFSFASFWMPDQLGSSAWIEHGPFAFWLVEALRPESFVELGTHNGYSYFTVCQAVQKLSLDTRCYAIDTWKGDKHAGFYGEEVYQEICSSHEKYSSFSRLVRSTFDEALEHFKDKSIDLLHIDGQHFYQDVKHDFESWLPKLSDRSVVIIHDTNVRENHFGVVHFWDELRAHFPHFEFLHGHGLGILGVGKSLPNPIRSLFEAYHDEKKTSSIREVYSRLGSCLNYKSQKLQHSEKLHQLHEELARQSEEILQLRVQLFQQLDQQKNRPAEGVPQDSAKVSSTDLKIRLLSDIASPKYLGEQKTKSESNLPSPKSKKVRIKDSEWASPSSKRTSRH